MMMQFFYSGNNDKLYYPNLIINQLMSGVHIRSTWKSNWSQLPLANAACLIWSPPSRPQRRAIRTVPPYLLAFMAASTMWHQQQPCAHVACFASPWPVSVWCHLICASDGLLLSQCCLLPDSCTRWCQSKKRRNVKGCQVGPSVWKRMEEMTSWVGATSLSVSCARVAKPPSKVKTALMGYLDRIETLGSQISSFILKGLHNHTTILQGWNEASYFL